MLLGFEKMVMKSMVLPKPSSHNFQSSPNLCPSILCNLGRFVVLWFQCHTPPSHEILPFLSCHCVCPFTFALFPFHLPGLPLLDLPLPLRVPCLPLRWLSVPDHIGCFGCCAQLSIGSRHVSIPSTPGTLTLKLLILTHCRQVHRCWFLCSFVPIRHFLSRVVQQMIGNHPFSRPLMTTPMLNKSASVSLASCSQDATRRTSSVTASTRLLRMARTCGRRRSAASLSGPAAFSTSRCVPPLVNMIRT